LEARLLDVGCGNGAFLSKMRALGWRVHGLEPDPAAAKAARASGIDVVAGTLADTAWPEGSFDAVTMSSVIEHLHDPGDSLSICRRLLAPGGSLHIMTPNADALGAARFGPHWRGLETPRHLVLFNPRALSLLLERCRFDGVTFHPHFVGEWFWLASGFGGCVLFASLMFVVMYSIAPPDEPIGPDQHRVARGVAEGGVRRHPAARHQHVCGQR
jgi:SAM-dependent methyltransferase